MRFIHALILCLLIPQLALAQYELAVIKAVSKSRRTFVTQHGRNEGVIEGQKVSFTTDNISLIVSAKTVTRHYTVWEVVEPGGTIPFEKGNIILLNRTISYSEVMARSKEIQGQKLEVEKKALSSLVFSGAFGLGVFQAVSGTSNANEPSVSNFHGNFRYVRSFFNFFEIGMGLRFDTETATLPTVTSVAYRSSVFLELIYYFPELWGPFDSKIFATGTAGVGLSRTIIDDDTQQGFAFLFPGLRAGMDYKISKLWNFKIEAGGEAWQIREKLEDDNIQTTTQVNAIMMLGFQMFFD